MQMIRFGTLDFNDECRNAIYDLINQKDVQLSMGKNVYGFEMDFAKWIGSRYAVFMNSGTSALMAAIQSIKDIYLNQNLNVKTVTTSALTYPANWNVIKYCGLKPYIQDVDNQFVTDMYMMRVKEHNRKNINITMPIHLLGKPVRNLTSFLPDIEDTCEALGSSFNGKKLGTFGKCGVFSFYVSHQISTVEGGMVVTDNTDLYENLLSARDNGRLCVCSMCTLKFNGTCKKRFLRELKTNERRWSTGMVIGGNFKPTEFQGVLGRVKMESIDQNINRRHQIFKRYEQEFNSLVEENGEYIIPIAYPVKVSSPQKACEFLEKNKIESRGMFPSYALKYKSASRISNSFILIPLHHKLLNLEVETIIEKVKKCQDL